MKVSDNNGPISPIPERTIDHETMPHFQMPSLPQFKRINIIILWLVDVGWLLFFKPVWGPLLQRGIPWSWRPSASCSSIRRGYPAPKDAAKKPARKLKFDYKEKDREWHRVYQKYIKGYKSIKQCIWTNDFETTMMCSKGAPELLAQVFDLWMPEPATTWSTKPVQVCGPRTRPDVLAWIEKIFLAQAHGWSRDQLELEKKNWQSVQGHISWFRVKLWLKGVIGKNIESSGSLGHFISGSPNHVSTSILQS